MLGRIVNVGRLGGAKAEFDFDLHALRRIDYIGVTFRTRSIEEVREITRPMRADLWDAVRRASCACRSTAASRSTRRRRRRRTCAPTRISARSC